MINIDEKLNISELLNIYGAVLTKHQAEMMRLYFDCDISLFEIASEFGISRQAVRDALLRGEKTLRETDAKLNIRSKLAEVKRDINQLIDYIQTGEAEKVLEQAEKTLAALEE